MSLYAYDECEMPIYAGDAEKKRLYKCCSCGKTVQVRTPVSRTAHFYHLRTPSSCLLYGKSQDHFFAQLSLQKILPPGETMIEKRFPEIRRIGDLVWQPHKIVFEIQCSNILKQEAEERVSDYRKAGYQVVWILDDRTFNRKIARPAERWMRQMPCYYATLREREWPIFYDQFEIFLDARRVKKGERLKIQIDKPCTMPEISWDKDAMPHQVMQKKIAAQHLYFIGDLIHKALLSHAAPFLAASMQTLRDIELLYAKKAPHESLLAKITSRFISEPLGRLMHFLQGINERWW